VPDKQSVYPEYLPARIRRVNEQTRMGQLVAHLHAHSNVEVLDLRSALLPAKAEELVFEQTGSHWNAYGAYQAYAAILVRLAARFPALAPRPLSDFEIRKTMAPANRYLFLTGVSDLYQEPLVELLPRTPRTAVTVEESGPSKGNRYGSRLVRETAHPELPSAVVFHDSFMPYELEPLLSEHFRRVVYLWQYEFDVWAIEQERPDLVIDEEAERYFVMSQPSNPAALSGAGAHLPRQASRR